MQNEPSGEYYDCTKTMKPERLIHNLVDIVGKNGRFNETGEAGFCAHDIRYTADDGAFYATCLGVSGDEVFLDGFKRVSPDEVKHVTMLGVEGSLQWKYDPDEGLIIHVPEKIPSEYANSLKIEMI